MKPKPKPIAFSCEAAVALPPERIAERILDVSNWKDFQGYGPLPGIKSAEFEVKTPEIVGSRIRVVNTDGSTHAEEIAEWAPNRRLKLRMRNFSAPLSRLAIEFEETWEFQRSDNATKVVRSLALHPTSAWTRPLLGMISLLLKRAVARHLRQLSDDVSA